MTQPAILLPPPPHARFVSFALSVGADRAAVLRTLAGIETDPKIVLGVGLPVCARLGGSYVAVQRWIHDLDAVDRMTADARAGAIGRDRDTNEELGDAPISAHVKRTAQESFDPPAFILRRSMPYGGIREHGLNFVAFGESLDRFEHQLRRMAGRDDGVPDGILSFTRAVTGGYYFCPPLAGGRYDLRALGA